MTTRHAPRCTAVGLSKPYQRTGFDPRRQVGPQYFVGTEWGENAVDVVARATVFAYEQLGEALDFMAREPSFNLAGSNISIAMGFIDNARQVIDDTIYQMVGQEELAKIYGDEKSYAEGG